MKKIIFLLILSLFIIPLSFADDEITVEGVGGTHVTPLDEGSNLNFGPLFNFVGTGVAVTGDGQTTTIAIGGGANSDIDRVGDCLSGDCLVTGGNITLDTVVMSGDTIDDFAQQTGMSNADSTNTDSDSGLEVVDNSLVLLRGCDDNEILKWDETNDDWNCEADDDTGGGGGGDSITVNSSAVDTTANFLDGDIDWTLTDGGGGGPDDITGTVACNGCVEMLIETSGNFAASTSEDGNAATADTVVIADNESTNETNALIFTPGGDLDGGTFALESDGNLNYNPSTGNLAATQHGGITEANLLDKAAVETITRGWVIDGTADENQLRLQGHSTQTSDILVVEDSSGNDLATVDTVAMRALKDFSVNDNFQVDSLGSCTLTETNGSGQFSCKNSGVLSGIRKPFKIHPPARVHSSILSRCSKPLCCTRTPNSLICCRWIPS